MIKRTKILFFLFIAIFTRAVHSSDLKNSHQVVPAVDVAEKTSATSDINDKILPMFLHEVIDLPTTAKNARDVFESTYYDQLIADEKFFEESYKNNLILDFSHNGNFVKNGTVFMRLIDFLEHKNNLDILAKLNSYFYVLFHQYIVGLEIPTEKQMPIISGLYFFYNNATVDERLRSVLTRMFIYILMVEAKHYSHKKKKELLLQHYEYFRSELHDRASQLHCNSEVLNRIKEFMDAFAAYSIVAPIVTTGHIKRIVVWSATLLSITGTIWYVGHQFGTWDEFWHYVRARITSITAAAADGMVKAFTYEYDPKTGAPVLVDTGEKDSKTGASIRKPKLNPNTANLVRALGKGVVDGIVFETDPATGQSIIDPATNQPRPNQALQRNVHAPLANINNAVQQLRNEELVVKLPVGKISVGLEPKPAPPAPKSGLFGFGWTFRGYGL